MTVQCRLNGSFRRANSCDRLRGILTRSMNGGFWPSPACRHGISAQRSQQGRIYGSRNGLWPPDTVGFPGWSELVAAMFSLW